MGNQYFSSLIKDFPKEEFSHNLCVHYQSDLFELQYISEETDVISPKELKILANKTFENISSTDHSLKELITGYLLLKNSFQRYLDTKTERLSDKILKYIPLLKEILIACHLLPTYSSPKTYQKNLVRLAKQINDTFIEKRQEEDLLKDVRFLDAFFYANREIIKDVTKRDENENNSPVAIFAKNPKHFAIVKELIDLGADPNGVDKLGVPAIHVALKNQNEAVVQLLIEQKSINLDLEDSSKLKPLDVANMMQYTKIISLLKEKKAPHNFSEEILNN